MPIPGAISGATGIIGAGNIPGAGDVVDGIRGAVGDVTGSIGDAVSGLFGGSSGPEGASATPSGWSEPRGERAAEAYKNVDGQNPQFLRLEEGKPFGRYPAPALRNREEISKYVVYDGYEVWQYDRTDQQGQPVGEPKKLGPGRHNLKKIGGNDGAGYVLVKRRGASLNSGQNGSTGGGQTGSTGGGQTGGTGGPSTTTLGLAGGALLLVGVVISQMIG